MTDESVAFSGATVRDADFSGARLRSPNLENAQITDGWLRNASISGFIGGLLVNGVEVAPLVQAELDRRYPERVKLRATDPPGLADAWAVIERTWQVTTERARRLPEPLLYQRVDDEWSFAETLRHLVYATDSWLGRMVNREPQPYHPWGIPSSSVTNPAIDPAARPTVEQILRVRSARMADVRATIESLTPGELARTCVPPDASGHPAEQHSVLHCLHVILDEEWEHSRYANRDLDILAAAGDAAALPGTGPRA